MKNKVRFFQSVNFKIALTFILILFIAIEIIGAYFIRGLERSMIDNFKTNMIVEELQKGYKLKDRVIRASLVKVSE